MDKYTYMWLSMANRYLPFSLENEHWSYRDIFSMGATELEKKFELGNKKAEYILEFIRQHDIDEEYDKFLKSGAKVVLYGEQGYPERLLDISDPPRALFYYGELPDDSVRSVAVIGARSCSEYGRYMGEKLGTDLATEGISVVSGMAVGIDGIAQMGALNAGGKSYGVIGSGVDICYPRANKELYERLKTEGGIISEYAIGAEAKAMNFPERNRIISGLSDGLIVVEAKQKSGTIITVDAALSQGRDIFVVPGRATDPLSVGCNGLIKQGAYPVQCAEDVLEVLCAASIRERTIPKDFKEVLYRDEININKEPPKKIDLETDENMVYSCFDFEPLMATELSDAVKMDISKLSAILIRLEMKGFIREVGRNSYVRCC